MIKTRVLRLEHAMEWPIKAIVRHFENRLLELANAVAMVGIAVWIVLFPDTEVLLISPEAAVAICMMLGMLQLAALIANGHWPFYGPLIRACCAGLAAFVWAQMCAALIQHGHHVGKPPSIDVPVYGTLALFELISMYRAMARANVDFRQQDP